MKMPEKRGLLAAILAAKDRHRGNPCICNGVPSCEYNGGAFTKTVIGLYNVLNAIIARSFVTFSTSPD